MARAGARLAALLCATSAGFACSVAAPTPAPVSCQTNEDCDSDEVCSADQGGVCVKAELPPRSIVGLRVEEEAQVFGDITFHVDLLGDDRGVRLVTSFPDRYRISKFNSRNDEGALQRPGVRDTVRLSALEIGYFTALEAAEDGEDYEAPLLDAGVQLSQESRLANEANVRPKSGSVAYPPRDPESLEPLAEVIELAWPHYDSSDPLSDRPLIAELRPLIKEGDEVNKRGLVYRLLERPPAPDEGEDEPGADAYNIQIKTTSECHRRLDGNLIVLPGPNPPPASLRTTVTMRYSTPHASASTIARPGGKDVTECLADLCPAPSACVMDEELELMRCGCEADEHCGPGQACDAERKYCALDLTGRSATQGSVEAVAGGDPFRAYVYTYCDDAVEDDQVLDLIVRVKPVFDPEQGEVDSGLPVLQFRANPEFEAATPSSQTIAQLPRNLCLPNWPVAQQVDVPLVGAPVAIGERGIPISSEYVCCETSCLEEDTPPSPAVETCAPTAKLSFSGLFVRPGSLPEDDVDIWEENECLPLYSSAAPEQGDPKQIGFTQRFDDACSGEGCSVRLSRGSGDDPIAYTMRVEPAPGSVFRSREVEDVVLEDGVASLEPLSLDYRVQLRGRVTLSDALCAAQPVEPDGMGTIGDCSIEREARVKAERIRVAGEDDAVLPPYVYQADTYESGNFVLPVNPGVYLVTAYPAVGSQGAASRIRVVDLRLKSTQVTFRDDGVPEAPLADPLELDVGQLATIELDEFHKSTVAYPVDLGSWARGNPLEFEGVPLDLNDTETCYSVQETPLGCEVRQLLNSNAKVLISQQRYVTFSTRN